MHSDFLSFVLVCNVLAWVLAAGWRPLMQVSACVALRTTLKSTVWFISISILRVKPHGHASHLSLSVVTSAYWPTRSLQTAWAEPWGIYAGQRHTSTHYTHTPLHNTHTLQWEDHQRWFSIKIRSSPELLYVIRLIIVEFKICFLATKDLSLTQIRLHYSPISHNITTDRWRSE